MSVTKFPDFSFPVYLTSHRFIFFLDDTVPHYFFLLDVKASDKKLSRLEIHVCGLQPVAFIAVVK